MKIAIIFVGVVCFVADGLEDDKCCSKDLDCASNEQCSNQKCKNSCVKHPCAENAICKVGATIDIWKIV